jgi:hypothetical protein
MPHAMATSRIFTSRRSCGADPEFTRVTSESERTTAAGEELVETSSAGAGDGRNFAPVGGVSARICAGPDPVKARGDGSLAWLSFRVCVPTSSNGLDKFPGSLGDAATASGGAVVVLSCLRKGDAIVGRGLRVACGGLDVVVGAVVETSFNRRVEQPLEIGSKRSLYSLIPPVAVVSTHSSFRV